jgi:hypothetical protein
VADKDGSAVRGRLVLCERAAVVGGQDGAPRENRRAVAVYLELQDASEAVGRPMQIFCDFGRTDFRPEYKGGLHCTLRDAGKREVRSEPIAFGGGVPASEWIGLPPDATIRLRSTPFGIHGKDAIVIMPTLDNKWTIAEKDPKEYFLSGTFTAEPDEKAAAGAGDGHIWRGTLDLPAVRIVANKPPVAAAADGIDALVSKLENTHGLWLNGVSPILESPANASADDVVTEVFLKSTPPEGRVTDFSVLKTREVTIPIAPNLKPGPGETYTAVHVKTNVGEKIVLLQHGKTSGWWSRIYDAKQ